MSKGPDVLERSAIPAGKVFIKAGEECERAYIVQAGEILAFTTLDSQKIEVARFGPGTIVGEMCLMLDEPINLSYEAVVTTTVVTLTRQDFQKRLARIDKTVKTILDHAVKKISDYERIEITKALKQAELDPMAILLVRSLISGVSEEKKPIYELAMLPHLNGLLKELKNIKTKIAKQV
jgi:CRP-like cAMP-binding protein